MGTTRIHDLWIYSHRNHPGGTALAVPVTPRRNRRTRDQNAIGMDRSRD
jgi:hypothetical protein